MTIKENEKSKQLGLFFPNAYLYMLHEDNEFIFEFEGIEDPQDFLTVIARGLHHTNRFGGQSKAAYTVLRHSLCIGIALDETGANASEVFQGLMHDSGEAFLPDIPSPFKTIEDEKRELACRKELPWDLLHGDFSPIVKKWDILACTIEANYYGHSTWDWPEKLEKEINATLEDKKLYVDIFQKTDKIPDYMIEDIWKGAVNNALNSL